MVVVELLKETLPDSSRGPPAMKWNFVEPATGIEPA